jgi:hypothetical protein
MSMTGIHSIGSSWVDPIILISNVYHAADNLSWVHGRHTVNVGFAFRANQLNTLFTYQPVGAMSFNNLYTAQTSGSSFNKASARCFLAAANVRRDDAANRCARSTANGTTSRPAETGSRTPRSFNSRPV